MGLIWPTGPGKITIGDVTFNATIEPPSIQCAIAWYGHIYIYRGPSSQLAEWCREIEKGMK